MAKIYPKDGKWYANYKDALKDKWRGKLCIGASGPLEATEQNRSEAQAFADALETLTKEKSREGDLTLDQWFQVFIEERALLKGEWSAQDIKSRYEHHIKTPFGGMFLAEMTNADVWPFVHSLKLRVAAGEISASLARNIYFSLAAILREAWAKHPTVIKSEFWALPKRMLPSLDTATRAPFTDTEVATLISCPDIPLARRVFYAVGFMTGARSGEIAALKWNSIITRRPLNQLVISEANRRVNQKGRLVVIQKSTKTDQIKYVPIIAELQTLLNEWFTDGFKATYGRSPLSDDFIFPRQLTRKKSPKLEARSADSITEDFYADLERAKVPRNGRVFHCARHTFTSLMRKCGADPSVTDGFTHETRRTKEGASRTATEVYTHVEWATACAEISKWKLTLDTNAPSEANALAPVSQVLVVRPYYQFTTATKDSGQVEKEVARKFNSVSGLRSNAGVAQLVEQRFCNSDELLPDDSKHLETSTITTNLTDAKPSECPPAQPELTTVLPPVTTPPCANPPTVQPLEPVSLWDVMSELQPGWQPLPLSRE